MADRNSVFVGIGIGCVLVILGIMAAAGACSFWAYRQVQQIERDMTDPELRSDATLEILGAEAVPEGYHPVAAITVPFLLKTAVLSDRPPEEGQERDESGFDERGFIFVETLGIGQDEQSLRDYFEGRTDDPSVLEDNGFNMDIQRVLDRGALPPDGDIRFYYMTQRGNMSVQGFRGEGLMALVMVDCPDDERRRIAMWFGPGPEGPEGAEPGDASADLTGTPGDPEAISAFLDHFSFCR